MYDIPSVSDVQKVIVTEQTVREGTEPQIVKKNEATAQSANS